MPTTASAILFVGLGAGLGGLCRYFIVIWTLSWHQSWLGVLIVNTVGSFVVGAMYAWILRQTGAMEWIHPLLIVGFLGSFTTFSAFALDNLQWLLREDWLAFSLNIGANVGLSVLAVIAGYFLFTP